MLEYQARITHQPERFTQDTIAGDRTTGSLRGASGATMDLDLLVGCLEKVKQILSKWWFNGDLVGGFNPFEKY